MTAFENPELDPDYGVEPESAYGYCEYCGEDIYPGEDMFKTDEGLLCGPCLECVTAGTLLRMMNLRVEKAPRTRIGEEP